MDPLATFQPGTPYQHSAGVRYEGGIFTIDGAGTTTPEHIRDMDAASQLVWRDPTVRSWFYESFPAAVPAAASTTPLTDKAQAVSTLISAVLVLFGLMACGWVLFVVFR